MAVVFHFLSLFCCFDIYLYFYTRFNKANCYELWRAIINFSYYQGHSMCHHQQNKRRGTESRRTDCMDKRQPKSCSGNSSSLSNIPNQSSLKQIVNHFFFAFCIRNQCYTMFDSAEAPLRSNMSHSLSSLFVCLLHFFLQLLTSRIGTS